jgi:hypothetical protein
MKYQFIIAEVCINVNISASYVFAAFACQLIG